MYMWANESQGECRASALYSYHIHVPGKLHSNSPNNYIFQVNKLLLVRIVRKHYNTYWGLSTKHFSFLVQCPPKVFGQFVKLTNFYILRIQIIPCITNSFKQQMILVIKQYGTKIRPQVSWGLISIPIV